MQSFGLIECIMDIYSYEVSYSKYEFLGPDSAAFRGARGRAPRRFSSTQGGEVVELPRARGDATADEHRAQKGLRDYGC